MEGLRAQIFANLQCLGLQHCEIIVAASRLTALDRFEGWIVDATPDATGVHRPYIRGPYATSAAEALGTLLNTTAELVADRQMRAFQDFNELRLGVVRKGGKYDRAWFKNTVATAAALREPLPMVASSSMAVSSQAVEPPPTYENSVE